MPTSPSWDEMFTIEPPPARRSAGMAAFVPRKTPLAFTSMTRSHSAAVVSSSRPAAPTPALLTSTSSFPKRRSAVATARSQSLSLVTSRLTNTASPPLAPIPAATAAPSASRMSPMTIRAPSCAKSRASTAPIPRAPPLMRATLPASLIAASCARCPEDVSPLSCHRPRRPRPTPPGRSGVDYTPAVIISRSVADNLTKASWIRRMFEEGARLKQERGADKVFDFTLGNPEIEPPPAVLAAAKRVLESDAPHLHAYMPNAGHPRVREAVAGRLRQATGLPYTANHVLMTVGAGAALNTVLKALLDSGDEVLTVAPYFAEYTFYAENHGGKLVVVPPKADLTPDVAKLAAAITPRTRAILVNSPNNPSGVIYPASTFVEIEALLARAARPIVLISDEPYRALVFDNVKVPEVPPLVTRSIVATSWSKSLAIPGERIGYLAFSPRMAEAADLFEACSFTSRVLGFVNAPALWQWVVAEVGDQVIDVAPYREKRDLMYEGLTRIGYQCVKPQGAFYVFPRTPIDDDVAFVRLLADEGVLTVPGSGFGMPGHIRISLTVERDTVVRALPGFERAFHRARGEPF